MNLFGAIIWSLLGLAFAGVFISYAMQGWRDYKRKKRGEL